MFDWFPNTPLDLETATSVSVEKAALKDFAISTGKNDVEVSCTWTEKYEEAMSDEHPQEKKIVTSSVLYGCGYLLLLEGVHLTLPPHLFPSK